MLKMEEERMMLLKECQQAKEEKLRLESSNSQSQERLKLFETHLDELRKEIGQAQTKNRESIAAREQELDDLRAELEEKQNQINLLQRNASRKVPQKTTMTGLPASVVNQRAKEKKTAATELKFKVKKPEGLSLEN